MKRYDARGLSWSEFAPGVAVKIDGETVRIAYDGKPTHTIVEAYCCGEPGGCDHGRWANCNLHKVTIRPLYCSLVPERITMANADDCRDIVPCDECALSSYGRDCRNAPIPK